MKITEELSEFIGALIGDGCLSRFWSKFDKRWVYLIAFTGDWDNDREYYKNFIQPIVLKEFGLKGYLYHRKDDNTVRFFIKSKKVILYLQSLGLPVGVKENILIPQQIMKNLNLTKACIRGIFNTDGSIYRRYGKRYKNHPRYYRNYAVIQFKLKNKNIIEFVKNGLEKMGLKMNRITHENKIYWICRITTQKSIDKFFMDIGTKHSYHLDRYKEIKSN